jgi:glycosyltransferase involved in cell wall biosynthesis
VKTVVLIDPYEGGHHLMYLRLFSKALLELGHHVIACCADSESLNEWLVDRLQDSPELIENFQTLQMIEKTPIQLFNDISLQPLNTLSRWYQAKKAISLVISSIGHKPDLVVFNWIDSYLSRYIPAFLIDIIFPYSWFGIFFQPKFDRDKNQIKFSFHQIFKALNCQGIGVLDDDQKSKLQEQLKKRVITFPDVTDEVKPDIDFFVASDIKNQAKGRKIIGLFGSLNKRKGLLTLLQASQQPCNDKYFFAFVGQLSNYMLKIEEQEYIQNIEKQNPSNCYFHFKRIPDEPQFNALVKTCDILFAAYEKFPYSSNILTKAAVFNKLLIGSNGYCIEKRVRQFQLGITIEEGNVKQCSEAIHTLCNELDFDSNLLNPDFESYRKLNSSAQVFCVFKALLEDLELSKK